MLTVRYGSIAAAHSSVKSDALAPAREVHRLLTVSNLLVIEPKKPDVHRTPGLSLRTFRFCSDYLSAAASMTVSITRSRLKLPGFWRGGNSLKLSSHWPTYAAAGAKINMWSTHHSG